MMNGKVCTVAKNTNHGSQDEKPSPTDVLLTHDPGAPLMIDLKSVMRYRREQRNRRHLVSHRAVETCQSVERGCSRRGTGHLQSPRNQGGRKPFPSQGQWRSPPVSSQTI